MNHTDSSADVARATLRRNCSKLDSPAGRRGGCDEGLDAQSVDRYATRSAMAFVARSAVFPCWAPPPHIGSKRSASVTPQPVWRYGARAATPMSDGTWKEPPVPTTTVVLFVNFGPVWQAVQPAWPSKSAL